jgi:hypothetical protein
MTEWHTEQQLRLFPVFEEKECGKFDVYINGRKAANCHTEEEAWDVIGRHPFGALHEVRDHKTGYVCPEFIPF